MSASATPCIRCPTSRRLAWLPGRPPIRKSSATPRSTGPNAVPWWASRSSSVIASPLTDDESDWAVCDKQAGPSQSTTTVMAAADGADRLDPKQERSRHRTRQGLCRRACCMTGGGPKSTCATPRVVRALRLDDVAPRPVSRALLDAIPEVPEITAPHIPGAGSPGPRSLAGFTVGTVVRITHAAAAEHYVVLADGVQRIGEVAADLIRMAVPQRDREIATVAPDAIGASPTVDVLPVGTFPPRRRDDRRGGSSGVVCPLGARRATRICQHRGAGGQFATARQR